MSFWLLPGILLYLTSQPIWRHGELYLFVYNARIFTPPTIVAVSIRSFVSANWLIPGYWQWIWLLPCSEHHVRRPKFSLWSSLTKRATVLGFRIISKAPISVVWRWLWSSACECQNFRQSSGNIVLPHCQREYQRSSKLQCRKFSFLNPTSMIRLIDFICSIVQKTSHGTDLVTD